HGLAALHEYRPPVALRRCDHQGGGGGKQYSTRNGPYDGSFHGSSPCALALSARRGSGVKHAAFKAGLRKDLLISKLERGGSAAIHRSQLCEPPHNVCDGVLALTCKSALAS